MVNVYNGLKMAVYCAVKVVITLVIYELTSLARLGNAGARADGKNKKTLALLISFYCFSGS